MTVVNSEPTSSVATPAAEKEYDPNMSSDQVSAKSEKSEVSSGIGEFKLTNRARLIFFTLAVLALMSALDGTSLSVALPIIAQALGGTAIQAFWAGTSFLLCSTVLQPAFGSFSNIFGRKPVILVSLLFFFVGALIAALSKNFTYMLVGRSLQGVGGGGIMVMTEIVVTDLVPLRLRGQYFAILSAMWSLGSVLGPILGGGFSQSVSWRWILYINFPFIGIGSVLVLLFLNLNFVPTSLAEKLRKVDWIGIILFVGSTASFMIPLTWGGVMYPWSSWRTLVPLLIGVAGLVVFAAYEVYVAAEPMIPAHIFSNRTATVTYIGNIMQGLVLWCALYYLPLYYEAVKGYSPIISGVAVFPETFTVAPMAIVTGILVTKYGRYRPGVWLGWLLSTVGMGLMCILEVDTSIPGWIFLNLVAGVGLGILFPSLASANQASASDQKNLAIAVAMFGFFRAFGQAMGVAIGGVVFQNQMESNLLKYENLAPMASQYSADAAGLVQIIKAMPDGADKQDLRQAYTDSLRIVWAVCCAISGAAFLLSLLTKEYDLNQALQGEQGIREKKSNRSSIESGVLAQGTQSDTEL